MQKPGDRATYLEKKLYPLWEKTRGQERRVPPDEELCELYDFFGVALAHEYLCRDAQAAPPVSPAPPTFTPCFHWFSALFQEWRDIYRQHWFIAELVVIPALGGGDHNGDTLPNLPKLRQGARDYAALRAQYHSWSCRLNSAGLPAPFAEYCPQLRQYSSYISDHLDPLPQILARHVQLRRQNGHWDEELRRTLLCGVCPDYKSFDIVTQNMMDSCEDVAEALCAAQGRTFKRYKPKDKPR